MAKEASAQLADFDVRPSDPERTVGTLSGGNQQRIVLARELSRTPAVLIAAYPTRGLDIAATRFVQRTLLELRRRGTAVLLVSADLDELLALSDRVGVLYRGRLRYASPAASADTRAMAAAMVGLSRAEAGPAPGA
jgi:simple sugar transport system ATP-binding protein